MPNNHESLEGAGKEQTTGGALLQTIDSEQGEGGNWDISSIEPMQPEESLKNIVRQIIADIWAGVNRILD